MKLKVGKRLKVSPKVKYFVSVTSFVYFSLPEKVQRFLLLYFPTSFLYIPEGMQGCSSYHWEISLFLKFQRFPFCSFVPALDSYTNLRSTRTKFRRTLSEKKKTQICHEYRSFGVQNEEKHGEMSRFFQYNLSLGQL